MNKVKWLRWCNAILVFSFLLQMITVLIIFFEIKLPHVQIVFQIHEYNGLLMIAVVLLHISLNWNWIKGNFFAKKAKA